MLDLRRLRTFQAVLDRRSFSAAALALDYTQSSVSQQVTSLEIELGLTLIDRGSRPIRPTAVGEVVSARAQALLGEAASFERELAELSRGEAGPLRVGGFFTAWATFLPAAVAAFSHSHPGVQLELQQLEPGPASLGVVNGDLDLAVVYEFPAEDAVDRVERTHLLDDPYAVALPAGHALAERDRVDLADLAEERWVSTPADHAYAEVLRRLCLEHGGFEPEVTYESGDIAMAQPLVAAGRAVALLPALGLSPRHAGVVVRRLGSTPPARSVWAIRDCDRRVPAASTMIDELVDAARRLERSGVLSSSPAPPELLA